MENNQSARKAQVSFLLGAGFSVPAGYPTASKLKEQLLSFDEQNKINSLNREFYMKMEIIPKSNFPIILTEKIRFIMSFSIRICLVNSKKNLEQSSILVIIGYSGGDSGINKYLKEYYKGGKW